ncbi:phage Gp37/Gp68 family protein [Acidithiobacillus ferriphilus]|uniref:DUF5131 family protein n=1 Tax=Acidithiobacillus ferriphilus TaxID=1689834 RepID=UPI002DBA184B|nr:phage Gp37/Gp68 family protein [Acidithiobacillus ferriphilus]MEB8474567.1 phage Gp37/Gp68 family protein [Acidithiobacillus ferriphilus]
MSDKTGIAWTNATWNPITGCTKVSQGCKNCYAEREWARLSANPKATAYYGRAFTDIRCHPDRLTEGPIRWRKPRMIFVNSMSDLFHEKVPFEFIDEVFEVINCSPMHTFQILTKRPERMLEYFQRSEIAWAVEEGPLDNVWLGVSVEDQATADERIPLLLQTPAAVRWVSAEPLLGPIDLEEVPVGMFGPLRPYGGSVPDTPRLDWVVCGGESGGPKARPTHPDWAEDLKSQCEEADVPYFFKQWGEWLPVNQMTETELDKLHRSNRIAKDGEDQGAMDEAFGTHCTVPVTVVGTDGVCLAVTDPMAFQAGRGGMTTFRVGVHKAGCKLNGKEWQEWPAGWNREEV